MKPATYKPLKRIEMAPALISGLIEPLKTYYKALFLLENTNNVIELAPITDSVRIRPR